VFVNLRRSRRAALLRTLLPTVAVFALTACSEELPQPEVAVECQPKSIEITITNTGEETARYTVAVEIERAGLVETERYSSNDVQPGETVVLTDNRPDDQENCVVDSVEVFS
jgi:hypothetical protein